MQSLPEDSNSISQQVLSDETAVEQVVKDVAIAENTQKQIEVDKFKTTGNSLASTDATVGDLYEVDGVWKRIVQVLTTRKAHVDKVVPFHKHAFVYFDDEVYDATLTERTTGITYITQLIYNSEERVYYVYVRSSETDYKLDGPHKTVEEAKAAFQVTYRDNFGVQWTERETAVNDRWLYEVRTYETFEEIEDIEEVVDGTEVTTEIVCEKVAEEKKVEVEITTATTTEENSVEKVSIEVVAATTGAGMVAAGALNKVDGVWKRTVKVLTTRKAHVDKVVPIHSHLTEDVDFEVEEDDNVDVTEIATLVARQQFT